ncbi:unnamed protein product [Ectocarpus sp. CCAP 1310/34]|nr:unnamed protein product [Ectocarpus sp. CCAP 1310/34]
MGADDEDESVLSDLRESIEEIEEENSHSDYSLEFDDDYDGSGHPRGAGQYQRGGEEGEGSHGQQNSPSAVWSATGVGSEKQGGHQHQQRQRLQEGRDQERTTRSHVLVDDTANIIADRNNSGGLQFPPKRSTGRQADGNETHQQDCMETVQARNEPYSSTAAELGTMETKELPSEERGDREPSLPVQVLTLKARLDGLLLGGHDGVDSGHQKTVTEALTSVKREHAALRECLGDIERELLTARRKVEQDAASRLQAAQQKRARAEARRVRHFEQLGEARRAAAVAKAEAEALRARLADGATELQHMRDMLETARSAASAAQDRADQCQKEAAVAEAGFCSKLSRTHDSRLCKSALLRSLAFRLPLDGAKLCERKRELEVDAATRVAEARERAAEEQMKRLPEHQQQLLQAERDRVVRWEERLAAEAASLQRREEAHKIDMEACRAQIRRMEAETRARVEEDASRERSTLTNAKSAFERERGELLRRVAAAESAGQAAIAEGFEFRRGVADGRGERGASESRGREGRSSVEGLDARAAACCPRRRASDARRVSTRRPREESRRAKEKVCRALEMEAEVVGREAAVEVKWKEITTARRAIKQMERGVVNEAEGLAEQRKALALARVRLHEHQMEMVLQMSEIRKALEVMKRVDSIEDAPARRLALELGTLACDRGQSAARRAENSRDFLAADGDDVGTLARREWAVHGGSDGRGFQITAAPCEGRGGLGVEVRDRSHQVLLAPCEETAGTTTAAAAATASTATCQGRGATDVMRMGAGAYADEAGAREALDKVRSVIASGGKEWEVASGSGSGGSWEGLPVHGWARRLQAAAIATGAYRLHN